MSYSFLYSKMLLFKYHAKIFFQYVKKFLCKVLLLSLILCETWVPPCGYMDTFALTVYKGKFPGVV